MRHSRVVASTPFLTLAALCGCQGVNRSPDPGPNVVIDTLHPTADFYARFGQEPTPGAPSIRGLSRENWQETTFLVPIAGIEHKPTYTSDLPRRTHETARQRGEYPTQVSAVEGTTGEGTNDQALEAVWAPVRAGWDILWMVPKMFVTPPNQTVSSPRTGYERGPRPNFASSGGLKSHGLGVTLHPLHPVAEAPPTTPAGQPPAPGVTPPSTPTIEPAPVPENEQPPAVSPPPRAPGGAIGGSDNPHRRRDRPPAEPKP